MNIQERINLIKNQLPSLFNKISKIFIAQDLEKLKKQYLGKDSELVICRKSLKTLSLEEKKSLGFEINKCFNDILSKFDKQLQEIQNKDLNNKLLKEKIDISLPVYNDKIGSIHPINLVIKDSIKFFRQYGFSLVEGPEIETDYFNFSALNFLDNHPARAMHDTFYVNKINKNQNDNNEYLARTHTSSAQVRALQNLNLPLRILSAGKVYRCDSDASHSPMFHQIEGMVVEENINMSHLKFILYEFLKFFFDDNNLKIRFRSAYFPFVEPGIEVDIKDNNSNWLEILGAGMTHPNVLSLQNIDCVKYKAFAFGLGVERLAMLRYNIKDIRLFYNGDLRFIKQFY